MKNWKLLLIVFMLIGLCVLAVSASNASATTYPYPFTIFGKTYNVTVDTNAEVSNVTMTSSGMGIQFQASVPSGITGFFNVTIPAELLGTDVTVLQDGVPLAENVSYTKESIGSDYLFHLEFAGETHAFAIEASTFHPSTPTPTPPGGQSGIPTETVITAAAVGAVAAVSVAIIYAFKGAIFHGAGGLAAGGVGGGSIPVAVGVNVAVSPHPGVKLMFSQVRTAGEATAIPLSTYPALPQGNKFHGTVFDIKTTALFAGLVVVGLVFDGKNMSEEDKQKLRVYRNDLKKDLAWEDVTSKIDAKNNIAYGATDHFSVFGVR